MHYLDIKLEGIDSNREIKNFTLRDFLDKNIILYFYPQDDTPVCTKEANYFKENIDKLKNFAHIIGVSSNNINDHIDFHKKYNLNFILLSDKNNELKNSFKEHKNYNPSLERTTIIIDKNGEISKVWEKVDVDGHLEEIFEYFKNL